MLPLLSDKHKLTMDASRLAVVKQRMQAHGSQFRTVADTFRTVYRNEGLVAFYVSYPTTLTMTVPFTAVQFSTYEFIKCAPPAALPVL